MRHITALLIVLSVIVSQGIAQDTVHVKSGWNLIGSVKAGATPDILTTIPDSLITSSYFGYTPGVGYTSTDTLETGLGYWIKVKADGVIIFNTSPSDECGILRVDYGGYSYGTVKVGSQCWLSENLNAGTMVAAVTEQTDNATLEKYCVSDDSGNCGVYGGLYQWSEANQYDSTEGGRGICPAGWHVPTLAEFETLIAAVGGTSNVLKQGGVGTGLGVGTNTTGFSALLAGSRYVNNGPGTGELNLYGYFWSSTLDEVYSTANGLLMDYPHSWLYTDNLISTDLGFSVRCLAD